jgi:hypothetical protein
MLLQINISFDKQYFFWSRMRASLTPSMCIIASTVRPPSPNHAFRLHLQIATTPWATCSPIQTSHVANRIFTYARQPKHPSLPLLVNLSGPHYTLSCPGFWPNHPSYQSSFLFPRPANQRNPLARLIPHALRVLACDICRIWAEYELHKFQRTSPQ